MPIQSLHLVNFQSHKDSLLEFSPNINCIIGASDQGKSVIMRAFHATIYNRPSGDEMVSDWIKDTKGKIKKGREMRLTLRNDNHVVERFRNEQNGYVVDGTRMEAIRTDVPQMVSDALNIGDVNVQKQMDAPFLISCSGGETARFINKMVNLEEIDEYLSQMSIFVNQANKDVETGKTTIKDRETSLGEFAWLDVLAPIVVSIEEVDAVVLGSQNQMDQIGLDLNEFLRSSEIAAKAEVLITTASALVSRIKKLDLQTSKIAGQFNGVTASLTDHANAQTALSLCADLDSIVALCSKIKSLDTTLASLPSVGQLEGYIGSYLVNAPIAQRDDSKVVLCVEKVKTMDLRISSMLEQIKFLASSVVSYNVKKDEIAELQLDIDEIEASRPEVCPTCGSSNCKGEEE